MPIKPRLILIISLFTCLICATLGTYFDSFLYHQPIVQITSTSQVSKKKVEDTYQNKDHETVQKVTGYFLNTKNKGQKVSFKNTYTDSQAIDYRYFRGQQAFVNPKLNELNQPKRDTIIVLLVSITFSLLVIFMHIRGLKTILSVLINISIFYLALQLNQINNGQYLFLIISGLTIILTAITLFIVLGNNKQFLVSFFSTISSTFLALGISIVVLALTHDQGIHYETIDYAVQPFKTVFLAEVLLGVLGAVMDETTDISSSLYELKLEHPLITKFQLFTSGITIGRELIGPLINVLFFIFMAESFPIILLFLRDENTIAYTLSRTLTLGFTQSIISSIGITLAVPITSLFSTLMTEVKQQ